MKNSVFLVVLCLLTSHLRAQQFDLSIRVIDFEEGPLASALVIVPDAGLSSVTNKDGLASFKLPSGTWAIQVSHLGYSPTEEIVSVSDQLEKVISLERQPVLFDDVTIIGSVADKDVPVTYTNIQGDALNAVNYGQDMPFLLNSTPSAVATSDAGNGIGYTAIRIRGSDATRVSVSINGIPYNDAESHQTFWVDLPDLAASVDDAQIQRGVGTSVNGVSAMGASINLNTNQLYEEPLGYIHANAGSFNTYRATAGFATGRLNEHLFLEGRVSRIYSDGFIDRAFTDLSSFFLTAGWQGNRYKSIVNVFSGDEQTYQSWGGVPKDSLSTDRTFNPYTYSNQTDNYVQTHLQWHHFLELNASSEVNWSFNYTRGEGYFEQLEEDQLFADYGVNDLTIGDSLISVTDLVTQRWLDNHFAGFNTRYVNRLSNKLHLTAGSGIFYYTGRHFGEVTWSEYTDPFGLGYLFYDNTADKWDANLFVQLQYNLNDDVSVWGDVQGRTVYYSFEGPTETGEVLPQEVSYLFLNPKAGMNIAWSNRSASYISVSAASKEPNRNDFVESSPLSRPRPEQLIDVEAGQRLLIRGWEVMANLYYMHYIDQLILTGEVNDVGAATRTNVPESFRAGIELAWTRWLTSNLFWEANAAFSRNKITSFTAFVDNFDDFSQVQEEYSDVDIAFSPSVIAFNRFRYLLFKDVDRNGERPFNASLTFETKYVSRQYIDNTMDESRSLDPYLVNDIQLDLSWNRPRWGSIEVFGRVNNLFNEQYEANAWVYRFIAGGMEQEVNGYFPQAGVHFMGGLRLKW